MTIIEFFDSIPIHNALSTLLLSPETLVLCGTNTMEMYAFRSRLQKIIDGRRLPTKVKIVHVSTKVYPTLIQKLETIIETYKDCVFDLTGGQTEIFVAMGALSQKYGVPMHILDAGHGTLLPLTGKSLYPSIRPACLSISENITLFGGSASQIFSPPATPLFWQDILSVWSVCKRNCREWNTALGAMHAFCQPEGLRVTLPMKNIVQKLSTQKTDALRKILGALRQTGALTAYQEKGDIISFQYKNQTVRRALSKEGAVLELYTYYAAYVLKNRRKNIFTDAGIGVVIDWKPGSDSYVKEDVKNEIDVFFMQGTVPVFISCKNGFVHTDELYKLSVVANRFGGPYAKKVLVITEATPDVSFFKRAKELGITVIQNANNLSPMQFSEKLADCAVK